MMKKAIKIPVISAGGVGNGQGILSMMILGACGVSIGSPFIATSESPVSKEYKKAVVDYGAKDIVMSDKISGTPCSVILTPYLKKIGVNQNFLESYLNHNKQLKKYAKMLTYYKGMKSIEKAAFAATYKTVWVAGPSIEFIQKIESVKTIVDQLCTEFESAKNEVKSLM
jgi:nitronate monooxygenase